MIAAIPYQLVMGEATPTLLGFASLFALVSAGKWRSDMATAKRLLLWSVIFLLLGLWVYLFMASA
jgi:hypothetical protein